MDLPTLIAQVATTVQQTAPVAADLATKTADAGLFTKVLTDIAKGVYGGKIEVSPPAWFAPLCAVLFGLGAMCVIAMMLGFDLRDVKVWGAVLFGGVTSTATAVAATSIHSAMRPSSPLPPSPPRINETCPTCGQQMGGALWNGSSPTPTPSAGSLSGASSSPPSSPVSTMSSPAMKG